MSDADILKQLEEHALHERKKLEAESLAGERVQGWLKEFWPGFMEVIYDPLEQETISTFRSSEFDPMDHSRVLQLQAILRVKDLLTARMNSIVSRGRNARAKLIESTTPKEGV